MRKKIRFLLTLAFLLILNGSVIAEGAYIRIENGYFFNPVKDSYWIPHGVAYQTWQTPAELKNDLDGIVSVGANAIRVDFVWGNIEVRDGVYDWSRYDMLLEEAKARGLKVFPIIGYQQPPAWFPKNWYTMHPPDEVHPKGPWPSSIISLEDPNARSQFVDFSQVVVSRYSVGGTREDLGTTVAGWILGNEFGYIQHGVIEYDGYDHESHRAFRRWLQERYQDIEVLNTRWQQDNVRTPGYLPNFPYRNFSRVDMPISFGYKGETSGIYLSRDKASWYDLIQWREENIADFIALAAKAVRDIDPHHLITYSSVSMHWDKNDWTYDAEDTRKIKKACDRIGAPLDFWSINNYPNGLENSELITGQCGIEMARHDTGLPVMITETGMNSGIDEERQARRIRNTIWESLESGAIGVFVQHQDIRGPKPAYFLVRDTFKKMDEIDIGQYLVGSTDPIRNIAFLWEDATDSIINRYKAEMGSLFGTLERLGYEPTFINTQELMDGKYLDYSALVLARNQKMSDTSFNLLSVIRTTGVKLHASTDIPGIMNEYSEPRVAVTWKLAMDDLFGIDATDSEIDPNLEDGVYYDGYETSSFLLNYRPKRLHYPSIGFNKIINMWKYRDEIESSSGLVVARFDSEDGNPALIFGFNTAISLFSLDSDSGTEAWTWGDRHDLIKTIYTDPVGFNIVPELVVSNKYVLVDYRITPSGAVMLSFKNYRSDTEETVEVSSGMIAGKRVVDLLTDELIEDSSDGTILQVLEPDGHDLVLAYISEGDGVGTGGGSVSAGEEKHTGLGVDGEAGAEESSIGEVNDTILNGPVSVVILEGRRRKGLIKDREVTAYPRNLARKYRIRTYVGSEYVSGAGREDNYPEEEIEVQVFEEGGITSKSHTVLVTQKELVSNINIVVDKWILGLKELWQKLIRFLNKWCTKLVFIYKR